MTYDRLIYRHRLWVRVSHWVNVISMTILLMSGLQIFNAHPALYWGNASRFDDPLLAIGAERTGQGEVSGVTEIGGFKFDTSLPCAEAGARPDAVKIRLRPTRRADTRNPCIDVFLASFDPKTKIRARYVPPRAPPLGGAHVC